jgi:hypothetical protein
MFPTFLTFGTVQVRILQVVGSDNVTNAEVRQRTNTKDIVTVAHGLKWKWGGHVARMDHHSWAQATSMWDIRIGKRTRRPKARWADTVKRVAGGQWSRTAKNRREWRKLTHHP